MSLAAFPHIPTNGPGNVPDADLIMSDFNHIRSYVNARFDGSDQLAPASYADDSVTDAKLESPNNSVYNDIRGGCNTYAGSGTGTKYFSPNAAALSTAAGPLNLFYFAAADRVVSGLVQKLRVRAQIATGGTGPGVTFTVGMYPVTAISGGVFTVGPVVTGSTVAFASTLANTLAQADSTDFAVPSDGYYTFGVANSGTSAPSDVQFFFQLQGHRV